MHRRLDLDGLVLGPLPPGRRDGARDAGRGGGREWGVPAAEIAVADGKLTHPTAGSLELRRARRAGGGDAGAGGGAAEGSPSEWTLIGNDGVRRYDGPSKTDGTHPFTLDVKLPGMLTAVMIHPPKFGASAASFDAAAAKAMPGRRRRGPDAARRRGRRPSTCGRRSRRRDAVTVQWDETAAETRGTAEIMAEYRSLAAGAPGGDGAARRATRPRRSPARRRCSRRRFEFPYLAHAALEPMNAVARMGEDGVLEVWAGHQMPDLYQAVAAQVAGVPPDKVRLHVMKTGGGFGRRAVADADVIVEAVAAARALNWRAPVKVQWTRENDMKGGRYRPAYVHRGEGRARRRRQARRLGPSHRRPVDHGGRAVRGDDRGRRRPDLGRGRAAPALRHPEPQGRADDDRRAGAGALVALGRLDAQRLRGRDLPRRARRGGRQPIRSSSGWR